MDTRPQNRGITTKSQSVVPPDNPAQRYRALSADRRFGSEDEKLAALRLVALETARRMSVAGAHAAVPATPGISNWVQLGPMAIPNGQTYGGARLLVTGRVTAIIVDPTNPQIIYVGAARGGVWKTADGGRTWVPKSDHEVSLAIGTLAMAPSNPQVLYAGTGEGNPERYAQSFPLVSAPDTYLGSGVLKSVNGGDSWTLQGAANFTGAGFFRIAIHPTDPSTAYAATSNGLFRTTDGGTAWVQMTNGLPAISTSVIAATDVVIDPSTPATVYAAFWGNGVYKTTNGSAANPAWTKETNGLPSNGIARIGLAISPSSPANMYALFADDAEKLRGLYETVTSGGGSAWSLVNIPSIGSPMTTPLALPTP